jgi:hypothetical protein
MNTAVIFDLIAKGVSLLPILVEAGIDIKARVDQLTTLAKGGAAGTITDEDLAKIRSDFDSDLDSFNAPID